jgi:membrane-associated protease RseP (regulator of RpoE activity)
MNIEEVEYDPTPQIGIRCTGRLRIASDAAYAQVDGHLEPLDFHTILTTDETDRHVIIALKGRIRPRARPWWPNALMLVLTLLSLLYVGMAHETADLSLRALWKGIPYALSMVLILGTHELGHYFVARRHGVTVTLPYFIPMPIGFGTLGAFIQLREPIRSRKTMFDIGIAGPLAGLVIAIPVLLIGLATSHVELLPTSGSYVMEGNSLLYAGAKLAVFGRLLPSGHEDVSINQLALAGWTGLFVTGLNLIPVGQLDGGHIISTLLGQRAQRLYVPILLSFLVLSLFNEAWLLWTLLLFFLGRIYAMPLDNVTPLDRRRRQLGYLAVAIFILVFVPIPLRLVQNG